MVMKISPKILKDLSDNSEILADVVFKIAFTFVSKSNPIPVEELRDRFCDSLEKRFPDWTQAECLYIATKVIYNGLNNTDEQALTKLGIVLPLPPRIP